jgi:ectoine hydroxylase-related dioxygenase (phytanoyl-CoA dioxygenase family)
MLAHEQIDQFHRDGFLNAGPVLATDELEKLTAELQRIIDLGPDGFEDGTGPVVFRNLNRLSREDTGQTMLGRDERTEVWQIVNIWEASPLFRKLVFQPFVVEAIAQLTGFANLQVWHDQVQYKPAGTGGATTCHQDAPLWSSIEPMTPVSAWIPFDDADTTNGCMWMIPGSHMWGEHGDYMTTQAQLQEVEQMAEIGQDFTPPAAAPIQEIKAVPCPVKCGEVHFHHSMTWHASPRNHSERPRRALAIHYMSSESTYTGRDHCMQQFIEVAAGDPMINAGPHFPIVRKDGVTQPA